MGHRRAGGGRRADPRPPPARDRRRHRGGPPASSTCRPRSTRSWPRRSTPRRARPARAWGTASLLHSLEGFFKPLFLGLTRAIVPSPGLLFKVFPQGWAATYRGCGQFTVSNHGPGLTRLSLRDLPPELRNTPYLLAICGTFEAAFQLSKYQGRAALEPRPPDAPEASWLVEWRPSA